MDLRIANIIIDARPVFAGNGRGFIGTANGWFSKVVKEGPILKEDAFGGKLARTAVEKPSNARHFGHGWARRPT
ncbi:hypothetical protein JQ617_22255 [Bradyrhizobium sp. KB893862 SZCCT0404]|nr:hypothetical protein [Bradyrhizobium sp. KB893862 SZCCT0404]